MDLDNSQPKSPNDSSSSSSSSTTTPQSPHDYSADRSLINDNDDSITAHSPWHSPPPAKIQDPTPKQHVQDNPPMLTDYSSGPDSSVASGNSSSSGRNVSPPPHSPSGAESDN
jgi:hypothetical protein